MYSTSSFTTSLCRHSSLTELSVVLSLDLAEGETMFSVIEKYQARKVDIETAAIALSVPTSKEVIISANETRKLPVIEQSRSFEIVEIMTRAVLRIILAAS